MAVLDHKHACEKKEKNKQNYWRADPQVEI